MTVSTHSPRSTVVSRVLRTTARAWQLRAPARRPKTRRPLTAAAPRLVRRAALPTASVHGPCHYHGALFAHSY